MKSVLKAMGRPFAVVYHKTHWFTDKEAWDVFRFFAFAEGIGWSLLIGALVYRALGGPEAPSVIAFCGSTHGMIMACYYVIVLVTARSMEWGPRRILVALVAGIPPYGTVVFEQFMARVRKKNPLVIEPPKDLDD
jgi:integral membrane protein